jgi:membrane complex biogenesis BtpA family protein
MALLDSERCGLVGMVHLQPLPGSPGWGGARSAVIDEAMRDAERLRDGGCDALLVENMGDVPYLRGRVEPETVALMAVVMGRLAAVGLPLGVQVLAGANREALGIAVASGAEFIRCEGFAYGHLADEGWMDACAGELLRVRAALGVKVQVWADVQKKHAAHALTADLSLEELASGYAFSGADALVITGPATGARTQASDAERARAAGLPVVIGSGVDPTDAAKLASVADALIVGSSLKAGGHWRGEVELDRVRRLRDAMDAQSG